MTCKNKGYPHQRQRAFLQHARLNERQGLHYKLEADKAPTLTFSSLITHLPPFLKAASSMQLWYGTPKTKTPQKCATSFNTIQSRIPTFGNTFGLALHGNRETTRPKGKETNHFGGVPEKGTPTDTCGPNLLGANGALFASAPPRQAPHLSSSGSQQSKSHPKEHLHLSPSCLSNLNSQRTLSLSKRDSNPKIRKL